MESAKHDKKAMAELMMRSSAILGPRRKLNTVLQTIWSGWAASVSIVLIVTIVIEAVPHERGISFFTELRYAIVMPLCILASIGAAFLYSFLSTRFSKPRWSM